MIISQVKTYSKTPNHRPFFGKQEYSDDYKTNAIQINVNIL